MRRFIQIYPTDGERLKRQLCIASHNCGVGVVLDGNNFHVPNFMPSAKKYEFIAGLENYSDFAGDLSQLQAFHDDQKDWLLGYLSYEVKNQLEDLESSHPDRIELPELYFFVPRYLVVNYEGKWEVGFLEESDSEESVHAYLVDINQLEETEYDIPDVKLNHQVSHKEYLEAIEKVLWHIQRGDIYELNYCMEFFAQEVHLSPQLVYQRLKEISPTPFSAYMKLHDKYLMCASPERYLKKCGTKVISQPIKGTSPRDKNPIIDNANKAYLKNSEKEQAENIMIADLVRNDLSRIATRGSVHSEELCGIYSFRQVHQMISTISAQLPPGFHWVDAIKATFPMGSMTGAPKISAMQLIEKYEMSKRGLYSGAVGYVTPDGDFDFNVVIRSVLYNQKKSCLSYMVGGAITNQSDPQKEYDECLLKASAIMKVFKIEE